MGLLRNAKLLVLCVALAATACAGRPAAQPASDAPWHFVAMGDMPYVDEDIVRYDRLIAAINALAPAPAFTIHVGDIKSGGSPCSDAVFAAIRDSFARFARPLIYTPGDNEWTDCHRPSAGGHDPLERLATLRAMFFADDNSHGREKLALEVQAADPRFAAFVENRRWRHHGIVFATVHVVGSNNNLMGGRDALLEYDARNAASLAWLAESFATARAAGARAIVVAMQANPDFAEPYEPKRSGFNDLLAALQRETIAFPGQVLLIHGDSHRFQVDMPMIHRGSRRLVENFLRVEVFGDRDIHAVIVEVDPRRPQPFAVRPLLVRENFVDHSAPRPGR